MLLAGWERVYLFFSCGKLAHNKRTSGFVYATLSLKAYGTLRIETKRNEMVLCEKAVYEMVLCEMTNRKIYS